MYRTDKLLTPTIWKQMTYLYGQNHQNREKINPLNKHEQRVFSQHGEDGVLHNIFIKIDTTNKYYVEFGAADGKWLSNTYYLRTKKGWSGLLLEANPEKEDPSINLHKAMVTPANINKLFAHFNVPKTFDLLSIDIDGDDFWVWKALTDFRPRVVIIETNASLPNHIPLTIPYNATRKHTSDNYFGANLRALYRLAKKKGYEFVTTVNINAIFVLQEEYNKLELPHVTENEAVQKYLKLDKYWYTHRDKRNRLWVNPFAKKSFESRPWMNTNQTRLTVSTPSQNSHSP